MLEEWRPVAGFEGLYEVSNYGWVKALPRTLEHGCRNGMVRQQYEEKILSPDKGKYGHERVTLRKEGHSTRVLIPRLVMETFVGPCPVGLEVCHIDSDPSNNRLDNLKYDSRKENQREKFRVGNGPKQKLTVNDIPIIRERIRNGDSAKDIASDYNIGVRQIYYINSGRTWGWV